MKMILEVGNTAGPASKYNTLDIKEHTDGCDGFLDRYTKGRGVYLRM
jgi:hypothetical protein